MEPKLSGESLVELRGALIKEIGPERTSELNEDDLDFLGKFFLTTMAIDIKMRIRNDAKEQV